MTVDRVSGFKLKSDIDFEEDLDYGKKPQVIVSVRSDTVVGPNIEQQVGPIVESEIQRWIPSDSEGEQEREIVVRIQDNIQQSFPDVFSTEGHEVVRREVGPTSAVGPYYRQHVEVETNLEVETTPVHVTEEDPETTEYTRKRTWWTTTRETTTSVKKETRSELEVFVVPKSRRTGDYFPDYTPSTENLEIQVKSRTALDEKISAGLPSQAIEPPGSDKHTELVIVEGRIMQPGLLKETEKDIHRSNEEICIKIENALGHEGRYGILIVVF